MRGAHESKGGRLSAASVVYKGQVLSQNGYGVVVVVVVDVADAAADDAAAVVVLCCVVGCCFVAGCCVFGVDTCFNHGEVTPR